MDALGDKQFFKIGDVAEIVGVKPHVLRYWESEFRALRPLKTRGAHRMYRRADVELLCLIRRLLHDEGFTIAGAKRKLRERAGAHTGDPPVLAGASRGAGLRAELVQLRAELAQLLEDLDAERALADQETSSGTATVVAVVPKTVLIQRNR